MTVDEPLLVSFDEVNCLFSARRKTVYALIYQTRPEVREFFDTEIDKKAQGRYIATLSRLVLAQAVPGERYHPLDQARSKDDVTGLAELKDLPSKTRIMVFSHHYVEERAGRRHEEPRIILLQGFQKKEDKLDPGEITRAITKRDWYLEQVAQPAEHRKGSSAVKPSRKR